MTAFATLAARRDVGCLFYLRVSRDAGATFLSGDIFSTHVSTADILSSTFSRRIVSLGNLERKLGHDYGFVASTLDVTLDNTDGVLDWLVTPSTYVSNVVDSVWDFYCLLWDPSNPSDKDTKQLGRFTILSPPSRDSKTVKVSLATADIGSYLVLAKAPSILDWAALGSVTDTNMPVGMEYFTNAAIGWQARGTIHGYPYHLPQSLAWGIDPMTLTRAYGVCYPICAVPVTPGTLPTTGFKVFVDGIEVPEYLYGFPSSGGSVAVSHRIWVIRRTPAITVEGKTWHLLWLQLDIQGETTTQTGYANGYQNGVGTNTTFKSWLINQKPNTYNFGQNKYPFADYDLLKVSVQGGLLSQTTTGVGGYISAAQIADAIASDCLKTSVSISGIDDVITGTLGPAASGSIGEFTRCYNMGDSSAIEALRGLCAVGQFDLFLNWSGTLAAANPQNNYTAQTGTFATLSDLDCAEIEERIPSQGQRGFPANRGFFKWKDGKVYGPYYINRDWLVDVDKNVDLTWIASFQDYGNFFSFYIDTTVRSRVTAVTGLNGLNYELGDYVKFSWRRGELAGPYSETIFRIEGISLSPLDGKTQIEMAWFGDIRGPDVYPYILDDETQYVRVSASGGRTISLTNGSEFATFSSGSLITDGVQTGDILKIAYASEAATSFYLNRTIYIESVDSATVLDLETDTFGAGGPFTITSWTIYKGRLTSSRAAYYGKTCSIIGEFFDGDPVTTRLLDG